MNNSEKLYIDIDEEITTIIDRLRHTSGQTIYVVVPQRALLLQSIVNLKLLEREAKKQRKRIILMTKDEEGIVFASRAGIEVQPFVGSEDSFSQSSPNDNYFSDQRNFSNQHLKSNSNDFVENNYSDFEQDNQSNFSYNENNFRSQDQSNQESANNDFSESYYSHSQNQNYFSPEKKPTISNVGVKKKIYAGETKSVNGIRNSQYSNQNFRNSQSRKVASNQNYRGDDAMRNSSENQIRRQHSQSRQMQNYPAYQRKSYGNSSQFQKNIDHQNRNVPTSRDFYRSQNSRQNYPQQDQQQSYAQTFAQEVGNYNENIVHNNRKANNHYQNQGGNISYFSQDRNRDFAESANSEVSYLSRKKPDTMNSNSISRTSFKNRNSSKSHKKSKEYTKSKPKSSFFSKFLFFLVAAVIVLVSLIFIFPKTELNLKLKDVNIDENFSFTAKVDQEKTDVERMLIPARQIKKEIVYTRSFDATGKADVTAQKAQGMVTINNETNEDIKMIKTTRFISENGVLFRLANDVVIPKAKTEGTTKVNGTAKVLLVADEAGEKGNVKSPTFFVATYKENKSDLYNKVYAKSDTEMTGGGAGGKNMPVVKEEDIEKAKENMGKSLEAYIKKEMNDLIKADEKALISEQIKFNIISSVSKVAPDTAVKSFDYEIVADVTAITFSQNNLNEIASVIIKKKNADVDLSKLEVKYDSTKLELDSGSLKVNAIATIKYKPNFDVEKFKKDIAGKTYTEVESLIKEKYSQINGTIEPKTFPSFMAGRISKITKMTEITVE